MTPIQLRMVAQAAALEEARKYDSNVIQDEVIVRAIDAALDVMQPYIHITQPLPPRKWFSGFLRTRTRGW